MPDLGPQDVAGAFAMALETMAFISPMPWEEGDPPPVPERAMRLTVRCHGRITTELEMIAGSALGAYLLDNTVGAGPDDVSVAAQAADAFRELMNIAAGVLIRSRREDLPNDLAIELPALSDVVTEADWSSLTSDAGSTVLDADGYPIAVRARVAA